jgi:hypothetical protein
MFVNDYTIFHAAIMKSIAQYKPETGKEIVEGLQGVKADTLNVLERYR